MRKFVKCISSVEEFDADLFNKLNLGVEIQDFTEPNLSETEKKEILTAYKEAFKNFKGIRALHGPFLDLKPSSPDLLIRQVSHKRYLDTLNIAADLDIDYIIFHSQINPNLNEAFISKLNNTQAKEFWDQILEETSYNNTIVIENIFEGSPEMLRDYMDLVDFPNIRVNLDIGHAKLGEAGLEKWIQSLKDKISYMHIHSNNGLYDQHQRPEDKEIEKLYYLLDKYHIEPILSLEYKIEDIEKEIKRYI